MANRMDPAAAWDGRARVSAQGLFARAWGCFAGLLLGRRRSSRDSPARCTASGLGSVVVARGALVLVSVSALANLVPRWRAAHVDSIEASQSS